MKQSYVAGLDQLQRPRVKRCDWSEQLTANPGSWRLPSRRSSLRSLTS